jgi:trigger factor
MNFQVEPLDTHEVRLTITIDDDDVNKARRDVARELSKQVRIPGFRPGNAPMNAIIRAVGGEEPFASQVADRLARDYYPKVIDEAKIDPYGPGQIEEVKQSPFQLIARVPLEPTVDLKDYRSIRLPASQVAVSEDEIESQLQAIREENVIVQSVERPAERGDLVEAVVVGTDGDDEVFRTSRRGFVLDADRLAIPGLAEAIVGMSVGEHKDTTITLPGDFDNEALRGKDIALSIDLERVSSRMLPDINDELAQTASSFETLAELREDLRTRLLEYKQRLADQDYAMQTLSAFSDLAEVSFPPAFLKDRLDDFMTDFKEDIEEREQMPFVEWLKLQGKTEDQVRDELRETAETRSKRGLVMRELARAEKLDVSDEEIAAEVEITAARYGNRQVEVRKLLAQEETRGTVKNNILSNKVIDRMVRIAKGEVALEAASESEARPVADQPIAEMNEASS